MCKWAERAPTQTGAMRDRDFDVGDSRSSDIDEVEDLPPERCLQAICNVPPQFTAQADRLFLLFP